MDLSGIVDIGECCKHWILRLIHQSETAKQRNLMSKHISSAVHNLMPPEESVWFRNRKKIPTAGVRGKKIIKIQLLVFHFIFLDWRDCPDWVCQGTNSWSRTVFPDNPCKLQIQGIPPSSCWRSEQEVILGWQGREAAAWTPPFIHPNLKQKSEMGFSYLSLPHKA